MILHILTYWELLEFFFFKSREWNKSEQWEVSPDSEWIVIKLTAVLISQQLTSWCRAACRHPAASAACSAWSCCARWISCRSGRRCQESRCCWPAGYSEAASPWALWSASAHLSNFGGKTHRSCTPAEQKKGTIYGSWIEFISRGIWIPKSVTQISSMWYGNERY